MNDIENFAKLFINDVPMLDVRAPVEFDHGSFPNTINIPLLNDRERELVGTAYKQQGKDTAVELGHSLVCGEVKSERIIKWVEFAKNNPEGCIFCFRGGMRSHIVQQWIKEESGIEYPLVNGGYKNLRRFLIDNIDNGAERESFAVISGRTGVGKTILIKELDCSVDLEGLAKHRGSSFGSKVEAQPSQINFENTLSIAMLKLFSKPHKTIFLEDESATIGRCAIPLSLLGKMKSCPVIILEDSFDNRIENIKKEYVIDMYEAYKSFFGEEGFYKFSEYLLASLGRIKRRLGPDNYKKINELMIEALSLHNNRSDLSGHNFWIESLLVNYYDPMYDYQLSHKSDRVVFTGGHNELLDYCSKK